MYFQLEEAEREEGEATAHFEEKPYKRLLHWCVYCVTFVFQMGMIWSTFSPKYVAILGEDGEGDSGEDLRCTAEDYSSVAVAGAAFMVLAIFVLLVCVLGISCGGPIAGGLFASCMGSGLCAGSVMSVVQSAAMGGGWCGTFYGVGAVFGATMGVIMRCKSF